MRLNNTTKHQYRAHAYYPMTATLPAHHHTPVASAADKANSNISNHHLFRGKKNSIDTYEYDPLNPDPLHILRIVGATMFVVMTTIVCFLHWISSRRAGERRRRLLLLRENNEIPAAPITHNNNNSNNNNNGTAEDVLLAGQVVVFRVSSLIAGSARAPLEIGGDSGDEFKQS